jgi:hypothetical protein
LQHSDIKYKSATCLPAGRRNKSLTRELQLGN